jgi:LPXTG-motif cell wall-anchored protein
MKKFNKIIAIAAAMAMTVAMSFGALADETEAAKTSEKNDSITVTSAANNETYTLYKMFDLVVDNENAPTAYSYTVDKKWDAFFKDDVAKYITKNDAGYVTEIKDNEGKVASDAKDLAAAAVAYLKSNIIASDGTITASDGKAKFDNLNDGYYLITSSLGVTAMIQTTPAASDVTIKEKNTTGTSEKKVREDSTSQYGDKDDADIGDTINYQSTVVIKAGQKNVVFHDQMTKSLTLDAESISLSVPKGSTLTSVDYEIKTTEVGDDTFQVVFKDAYTTALTSDVTVTISYSATLNENAVVDAPASDFGKGNDNKSKITFGDNQETSWDWTRTYTWTIPVYKYTENANKQQIPLKDAKFNLKKDGKALTFTLVTAGDATNASIYKYDKNATNTELVTPESGKIVLQGLDADTYSLEETAAPSGYNKLAKELAVVVGSNTDAKNQGDDNNHQADGAKTLKVDNVELTEVGVLNTTGNALPSTGGMGTTILYVAGAILVIAGAAVLVIKKRHEA